MATDAIGCEKAEELKSRINEINSTLPIKTYTYISTNFTHGMLHFSHYDFCSVILLLLLLPLLLMLLLVSDTYQLHSEQSFECESLLFGVKTVLYSLWYPLNGSIHENCQHRIVMIHHLHSNRFVGQSRDWTVELLRYCVIFFGITY